MCRHPSVHPIRSGGIDHGIEEGGCRIQTVGNCAVGVARERLTSQWCSRESGEKLGRTAQNSQAPFGEQTQVSNEQGFGTDDMASQLGSRCYFPLSCEYEWKNSLRTHYRASMQPASCRLCREDSFQIHNRQEPQAEDAHRVEHRFLCWY